MYTIRPMYTIRQGNQSVSKYLYSCSRLYYHSAVSWWSGGVIRRIALLLGRWTALILGWVVSLIL